MAVAVGAAAILGAAAIWAGAPKGDPKAAAPPACSGPSKVGAVRSDRQDVARERDYPVQEGLDVLRERWHAGSSET